MIGDGTNDVGALKKAHVGISLLNSTNAKKIRDVEEKAEGSGSGSDARKSMSL